MLILAFLLISTCIRRRRAQKFDRDVAEAAAHAAATSHNVDPDLDDDDALGHLGGGFGAYGHTPSKSSHGTYLSGSAAGGEPVGFAAYGDYPPGPPQESYNMADLGARGGASVWQHQRTGSEATAPGVAGVGAGETEGAALRYRRTQSSAHGLGQRHDDGFYDAAAAAGGYHGASGPVRVPEGGYDAARLAPQALGYPEMQAQGGYRDAQAHGGYSNGPAPGAYSDGQAQGGYNDGQARGGYQDGAPQAHGHPDAAPGQYLTAGAAPHLDPYSPNLATDRTSAAYSGYDESDPFAVQSQLSHSQGHSVSPPLPAGSPQPGLSPQPRQSPTAHRSPGSQEGPLSTAFGPRSSEDGYAGSDTGSLGDEEDYAGGRRVLKVRYQDPALVVI